VTVNSEGGLRARKKEATRQALHAAAVRLATELGPEHVTVEAVADAADVSRRTFSNYFANKDEALLYSHSHGLARVIALVEARPPGETAWTALTRASAELAPGLGNEQHWHAALHLVRNHPSLLSCQVAAYARAEGALTASIARRLPAGDDLALRAHIQAATYLGAMRAATHAWLDQSALSLTEMVTRALRIAGQRFT